jgi:hypothetical protein
VLSNSVFLALLIQRICKNDTSVALFFFFHSKFYDSVVYIPIKIFKPNGSNKTHQLAKRDESDQTNDRNHSSLC